MSILHSQQSEALINRLVKDQSSQPRSNTNQFDGFIRSYYYGVPYDDLSQRDIFDLRGAALAHWELCAKDRVVKPKSGFTVRTLNEMAGAQRTQCWNWYV